MGRQEDRQRGFSIVEVLVAVAVIAVIAVAGVLIYQHHKAVGTTTADTNRNQSSNQQQRSSTTTQPQPVAYLNVTQWGVKLPLSNAISDMYYVVPTGISNDPDGLPSGIWLGLKSLDSSCGAVTSSPTNLNYVGEIVRALPTATDPVSGKLYTQLDPNGTTINGYYYGYSSAISGKTCASSSTLQTADSAVAAAAKGAVSSSATN